MFTARGLGLERNGETITPYYFALEDLKEDWAELAAQAGGPQDAPQVLMKDFTEVMCLAQGITAESLGGITLAKDADAAVSETSDQAALEVKQVEQKRKKNKKGLSRREAAAAMTRVGVVPPRRELAMLKRYYRDQSGIKGEFAQSRIYEKR